MKKMYALLIMFLLASVASAQTFRFVAWGDSRGSSGVNTSVLPALSTQVNGLSPAFTIFSGDLCPSWGSACTANGSGGFAYSLGPALFAKTFVYRGNHDNSSSGWDSYFAGHAAATVTAIGGSHFAYYSSDGPERTYSFDYGNSHFVGIDMPGGDVSSMASGQIAWLGADLTAAEARGITNSFLNWHGPYWYIDEHSSTPPAALTAVLNAHPSFKAAFFGHEHVLGYVHMSSTRSSAITHPWEEFVSGGAGAPLYSCTSGRYDYCSSHNGFMTVDVNGAAFTVNLYYSGSNTVVKTWSFGGTPPPPAPIAGVSPASLNFPSQVVGTTSSTQPVTLRNTGDAALLISSITTSLPFLQNNTCGSSLAAGASCTINVSFQPISTGSVGGLLTINDNANSPQTVNLTGTGASAPPPPTPSAALYPASLSFPSQIVGTTSVSKAVTLTNAGGASLTISSLSISGDFTQTNNCGTSLAAGGVCTLTVSFKPTATGTRTGTLTATDNAAGSPQVTTLSGTGASTPPVDGVCGAANEVPVSSKPTANLCTFGTASTVTGSGPWAWTCQGLNGGQSQACSAPLAAPPSGTDFYVSPSGSNSNAGTQGSPWATLAYADSKIGPGSTVHVLPGSYGAVTTRKSGLATSRIIWKSEVPWGAKVGSSSSGWDNYGDYVDIVGFDASTPGINCLYTEGRNTRFIGNNVHGARASVCNGTGGSGINANGPDTEVIGNYIHDNGPAGACGYVHGVYFLVQGGKAYNNISVRNSGYGIQLWHDAGIIDIVNNTFAANRTGGVVVGNNVSTADNCHVNNNIFYQNAYGLDEQSSTGTHNTYQNNLMFGNTGFAFKLQHGNVATGTLTADPQFTNFAGDDYTLKSTSPAIDAGTANLAPSTDYAGNSRPLGNGFDIGAYEFTGSVPPPPVNGICGTTRYSCVGLPATNTSDDGINSTWKCPGTNGGTAASCTFPDPIVPPPVTGASLTPNPLIFPNQAVGTTSPIQFSTFKNTGTVPLTISSAFTIAGDFAFGGTGNCPAVGVAIPAGASCTVSVVFKPTASGSRSGSVTIRDSAAGSPHILLLSGTAGPVPPPTAPLLVLSPGSLNVAPAQVVTLSNTGTAPLTISSITLTGANSADFAILNNCGATLAVGGSCTVQVSAKPTALSSRTASITITDNAAGSPHIVGLGIQ